MAQIDLSQLPPPAVIEPLDYESIRAEWIADLRRRWPAFSAELESEPVVKVLEMAAYRELLLRQRINEAGRALMLATARGADLDHLVALLAVERQVVDPGDDTARPPVPPTHESDDRLRHRAQLAVEGFASAGSAGAYRFHALASDPGVRDVAIRSPSPGQVSVNILSTAADGRASADLLAAVRNHLNQEDVRPLTDQVRVAAATVVDYRIEATLAVESGPDPDPVLAAARRAVGVCCEQTFLLGQTIYRSALIARLHVPGVETVTLTQPARDVAIGPAQAGRTTAISVEISDG